MKSTTLLASFLFLLIIPVIMMTGQPASLPKPQRNILDVPALYDVGTPTDTSTPTPSETPTSTSTPTSTITPTPTNTPTSINLTLLVYPYLGNPTTSSVVITWATDRVGTGEVHYSLDLSYGNVVAATGNLIDSKYWYSATITGLAANTTYYYKIFADGSDLTPWSTITFTTVPGPSVTSFSFAVVADSQQEFAFSQPNQATINLANQMKLQYLDLILRMGDMVADGSICSGPDSSGNQFLRNYFNVYRDTIGHVPSFTAVGNHELQYEPNCGYQVYTSIFSLPENAPSGDTEHFYSFDWGNVHFISLNAQQSYSTGSAQYNWLVNDLQTTTQPWKIVFFHDPAYSSGEHGGTPNVQTFLVPLFEAYGVNAAFSGHDHDYERTCPIRNGGCTSTQDGGVVYYVAGSGGGWAYPVGTSWFTAYSRSTYQFLKVNVSSCQLQFNPIDSTGVLFDSYVIDRCSTPTSTPDPNATATPTPSVTPTPTNTATSAPGTAFARNSNWKYYTQNTDLLSTPTLYYSTAYNDSAWASGNGILGFGEGYLTTTFANHGGYTYYFRKTFDISQDPASITSLIFEATYDDGFVCYINGQEVTRGNMASGTYTYTTAGQSGESNQVYTSIDLTSQIGKLVQGTNIITCDVHNSSTGSSDIVWDASLTYESNQPAPTNTPNPSGNLLVYPYLGNTTSSSVTISWVTDSSRVGEVHYSLDQNYGSVAAATSSLYDGRYWYSATLSGLTENTTYYYKIFNNGSDITPWSTITFTTQPGAASTNFTFAVLGDSQLDSASATPYPATVNIANQLKLLNQNLVLHSGDIIFDSSASSGSSSPWSQYVRNYFNVYQPMLGNTPFFPAIGNHEVQTGAYGYQAYKSVFSLPGNAPSGDTEEYYSFDWGNAHFVSLDTNQDYSTGSVQYNWLVNDLQTTTKFWKIVTFHVPAYSSGSSGSEPNVGDYLVPLFETYGVNLVFNGHDHSYQRTCPIRNGSCTTIQNGGVVYYVNSSGAYASNPGSDWFTAFSSGVSEFLKVQVADCQLQLNAIDQTGYVFDSYVINRCGTSATVTLSNLNQIYDGLPKSTTATTNPPGLAVSITYNGSATEPTNAGSYAVVATINDPIYTGSATGTLVIAKASSTTTISGGGTFAYNGSPRAVTVSVTGAGGLSLSPTPVYSGACSAAPVNVAQTPCTASYTYSGDANHTGSSGTTTITITRANGTVTLGSLSQTYDGTPKPVTVTTNPASLSVNVTYGGSTSVPTNAGSYAVVATITDPNYTGTASGMLVIAKAAATVALSNLNQTYDGTPRSATATTTPSGLAVGITYDGSSTAPTNAGSYAVVATITDPNHTGSASGTLVIVKAGSTTTVSGGGTFVYNGSPRAATVSVTGAGGLSLNPTPVYSGACSAAPVNVADTPCTASYTFAGDTNHAGSSGTTTITITSAAATVTLSNLSQTYDGTPKSATATTNPTGLTVNITYDGSGTAPTNAGSYAVIATIADPNYTGTASGTLVIAKASSTTTISGGGTFVYNGSPRAATVSVTGVGGLNLIPAPIYSGACSAAPVNVADTPCTASYTFAGDTNHTGSSGTTTITITRATATVTLSNLSQTYDGTPKSVTITTNPSGLSANVTYNGLGTAPTNAGSYAVVGTVNAPNYMGTGSGTLVIAKAAATVTLGSLSQTYDGTPKSATATTTPSGLTVGITYDGSGTAPTNAGSYAVIGTITDPNYAGTASGTLVIAKAAATVALSNLNQTYDGTPKSATATTTPSGLTVGFTYDGSSTAPTNAGSYAVVATITDPNHTGSASGTLVIAKAGSTTTVSGGGTFVYNGSPRAATVSVTGAGGLSLNSTPVYSGACSAAPVNVADTPCTASYTFAGDTNHTGSSGTTTIIITPSAATVTLSNLSQTYDGTPKSATATTNPTGLTVNITYDGSGTAPTNAGSYAVIATIADPNYTGTASGTLVIAKASSNTTISGGGTFVYNGSPRAATVSVTGVGGLNLIPAPIYSGACSAAPVNVADTPCTASYTFAGDTNHTGSSGTTTITITRATATVTLGSLSQTYDGNPKPATATTNPPSLTVTFTYSGLGTAPTNAGSYAVVATITNPNYTGSASGTLVIAKAAAMVTLGSLSQTYDGTPRPATATTTPPGLAVGITYDGSGTAPMNAGSYAVIATIADPNYTGIASGTLVIAKATATVTLGSLSQTYDGTPKTATATTNPPSLLVDFTYDGSSTVPTNAGSYAVVATINDLNFSGTVSGTLVILSNHSISLLAGWNLVSFNVHPTSTAIENVLADISGNYDLVYVWDATGAHSSSGNWMKYAPPPVPPYQNTLSNLNETMGFWIHMTAADTLDVAGSFPTTTNINFSYNVGGWNLVGYPSLVNRDLPAALVDHGVGTDFSLVYSYRVYDTADLWKLFDRTGWTIANDLKYLSPGWGYWIKVSVTHTWDVEY